MGYILYCEDNAGINNGASSDLKEAFPEHSILPALSLDQALELAQPVIKDLKIVCTDGDLGNKVKDGVLSSERGWDLARKLRQMKYQGPIIFTGSFLPPAHQDLFVEQILIKTGDTLIDTVRKYL